MAQAKDVTKEPTAPKELDGGEPRPLATSSEPAGKPHQRAAPAKEAPKDVTASKDADGMPAGSSPIEYRQKRGVHLADAGRVVKQAWVGRVLGRSVRVYRGTPESALPSAVRRALADSKIEVGVITLEELGLRPSATGIVNLTNPQG